MQKLEVRQSSRTKRSTTTDLSNVDTDGGATAPSNIDIDADTELSNVDTSCRYHCTVCSKSFSRMDNLRVHERSTHGKVKIKCKTCKKHFSSQLALDRHEVTHSDDRPHQCTVCDMTFKRADAMKTHHREVHQCDSEFPLRCEFYWCSKKFYTKVALERHVKMHKSTSVHWSIIKHCDKCSSSRETPKFHQVLLSETSEWLWHQCSLCLKTFQTCQSLQQHKRSNFNWKIKRTYNSNGDCSHGKQIVKIGAQCKICWKLFSSKHSLTKHEQTQHTIPTVLYLKKIKDKPKKHGHWVLETGGWKWKPLDPSVDLASLPTISERIDSYNATRTYTIASSRMLVASSTVPSSSVHATTVASSSIASSPLLTSVASVVSSSPVNLGALISVSSTTEERIQRL